MPTLHWLTRDEDVGAASRAPYRLLEEAPELSVGDAESDVQPLVESLEAAVLRWRAA